MAGKFITNILLIFYRLHHWIWSSGTSTHTCAGSADSSVAVNMLYSGWSWAGGPVTSQDCAGIYFLWHFWPCINSAMLACLQFFFHQGYLHKFVGRVKWDDPSVCPTLNSLKQSWDMIITWRLFIIGAALSGNWAAQAWLALRQNTLRNQRETLPEDGNLFASISGIHSWIEYQSVGRYTNMPTDAAVDYSLKAFADVDFFFPHLKQNSSRIVSQLWVWHWDMLGLVLCCLTVFILTQIINVHTWQWKIPPLFHNF